MIAIVDYGLGNVHAIANIYDRLNIRSRITGDPAELAGADRLILPGVGSFDWAMSRLNDSGLRPVLDDLVVEERKPILGICVGMQMMTEWSDEGELPGLGWIDGGVEEIVGEGSPRRLQLPHMGWNDVRPQEIGGLFGDMDALPRFYFLHSYCVKPMTEDDVIAKTDYCGEFVSAVGVGNVYGVQFHPEKSHHWGIQLLKNFAEAVA